MSTTDLHPNSAIDVGAANTRREIRERIFIRQVSHNEVDAVHTSTRQGGMVCELRPFCVDFSSRLIAGLIIHLPFLFGLRLRLRLQCMSIVLSLIHHKTSVQFHPIADLGLHGSMTVNPYF